MIHNKISFKITLDPINFIFTDICISVCQQILKKKKIENSISTSFLIIELEYTQYGTF